MSDEITTTIDSGEQAPVESEPTTPLTDPDAGDAPTGAFEIDDDSEAVAAVQEILDRGPVEEHDEAELGERTDAQPGEATGGDQLEALADQFFGQREDTEASDDERPNPTGVTDPADTPADQPKAPTPDENKPTATDTADVDLGEYGISSEQEQAIREDYPEFAPVLDVTKQLVSKLRTVTEDVTKEVMQSVGQANAFQTTNRFLESVPNSKQAQSLYGTKADRMSGKLTEKQAEQMSNLITTASAFQQAARQQGVFVDDDDALRMTFDHLHPNLSTPRQQLGDSIRKRSSSIDISTVGANPQPVELEGDAAVEEMVEEAFRNAPAS